MYRSHHFRHIVEICLCLLCMACGDDKEISWPEMPDPVFHFDETTFETDLGRDTADYIHLNTAFTLPEKIGVVEIYSENESRILESKEEYKGQTSLSFDYPIDITDLMQDTTLAYTIKVTDGSSTSFTKKFIYHIKPFSTPQILLRDGNCPVTDLPVYLVRAEMSTGNIPISKVSLSLDGKEIALDQPEEDATFYRLDKRLSLNYLKEYRVRLQVVDADGRQSTRIVFVNKIAAMEKPVRILVDGDRKYEMDLNYNEENGKIDRIDVKGMYRFILERDRYEISVPLKSICQEDLLHPEKTSIYSFNYNSSKKLESITRNTGGTITGILDECRYSSTGVSGYKAGNLEVDGIRQEDLKMLGTVETEIWEVPFSEVKDSERKVASVFQTVRIPCFIGDIPNAMFIPYDLNIPFQDLFMTEYVHLKNVSHKDSSTVKDEYTYETDKNGRLYRITKAASESKKKHTYTFIYSDTL